MSNYRPLSPKQSNYQRSKQSQRAGPLRSQAPEAETFSPQPMGNPTWTSLERRPLAKLQFKRDGANKTGLPDHVKAGVEHMSGMSMDHVGVHYNSPKPAQLNAHAYAQGNNIHMAPGQGQHVAHEAWHVAQQAQGRVAPTTQFAGQAINNDQAQDRVQGDEDDDQGRQVMGPQEEEEQAQEKEDAKEDAKQDAKEDEEDRDQGREADSASDDDQDQG